MAADSAGKTPRIPGETLSDRDILLHLLQHAEHQFDVIEKLAGQVDAMHEELEMARPLLERAQRNPLAALGGIRLPWQG